MDRPTKQVALASPVLCTLQPRRFHGVEVNLLHLLSVLFRLPQGALKSSSRLALQPAVAGGFSTAPWP